ncbi:hypothetical protein Patl1_32170 [Pistacia atlantica]|uniref:Uncharacterized protein n=1 Tax=Pistacia atlantica TaxID=434234 RepID=A0ACC1ANL1_9ROSI|nr:hypothetical protein Patl1_32170 [Pistacia atlantica]
MNVKELISHLRQRLNRNVTETQMVPFKIDNNVKDAISNGENKDKESFERGGRDKRDKEAVGDGGDGNKRVEVGGPSGCDGRYDNDTDYEDDDAKMELYDGYTYYIYPVESSQEYMRFMAANIMRGP